MDKVLSSDTVRDSDVQKYMFRSLEDQPAAQTPVIHTELGTMATETPVRGGEGGGASSSMIETLLAKVDDLSTSLVKMEFQLEKQQEDFAVRLESETRRAYDEGVRDGIVQGGNESRMELAGYQKQLTESLKKSDDLARTLAKTAGSLDDEIVKSALMLARQVIAREVSRDSAAVAAAVAREVLSSVSRENQITLKVHPDDETALRQAIEDFGEGLKIYGDAAVAPGGVVLLSDTKNLDASLVSRFENLTKNLLNDGKGG